MRMLLTPYIQPELGLVVLKTGSELLPAFRRTARVLISDEPEYLKQSASGLLPDAIQDLASDEDLIPFLTDLAVIGAAGGKDALIGAVRRKKECQWPNKEHCHKETTLFFYDGWPVKFCWHHDNKFREWDLPEFAELTKQNKIHWVLDRICSDLCLPIDHQLTLPEIFAWSVIKKVSDKLPEAIALKLLNRRAEVLTGELKEADIKPYDDRASIALAESVGVVKDGWEVLSKPVIKTIGDEAPPQSFMLRPKLKRWSCEKYTGWVKTQTCRCCGNPADDSHHIIGHGQGAMGTKAHDLFVIPLCRRCHDELHKDVGAWEKKHGNQIEILFRFLDWSLGVGAIVIAK